MTKPPQHGHVYPRHSSNCTLRIMHRLILVEDFIAAYLLGMHMEHLEQWLRSVQRMACLISMSQADAHDSMAVRPAGSAFGFFSLQTNPQEYQIAPWALTFPGIAGPQIYGFQQKLHRGPPRRQNLCERSRGLFTAETSSNTTLCADGVGLAPALHTDVAHTIRKHRDARQGASGQVSASGCLPCFALLNT